MKVLGPDEEIREKIQKKTLPKYLPVYNKVRFRTKLLLYFSINPQKTCGTCERYRTYNMLNNAKIIIQLTLSRDVYSYGPLM